VTDPFAEDLPRRDGYGRPLIPQPDGTVAPYTRISTLSNNVTDKTGLHVYEKRCVAIGLGNDPGLAAAAGSLGQNYYDLSKEDKHELDEIIALAHEKAGGNDRARYGTTFHRHTEPARKTTPPANMAAQVTGFYAALKAGGWAIQQSELFVLNHQLRIAGTYDHTVLRKVGGKPLLLDKKTGKKEIPSWLVQLSAYSLCSNYNPQTGETSPMEVNQGYGIIAWAPREGDNVDLLTLPLDRGREGLNAALAVRDWRTEAAQVRPIESL
jgi:hypothetical protein